MILEPYCCPCGACIEGLKIQLQRACSSGQFEDTPWLHESLQACQDKRREIPRYAEADERKEREARIKEARRALG